jgi:RNA polymerase sigma factor for flagellar operon FliA
MLQKQKLNAYATSLKQEQDDVVVQYMPAVRAMAFRLKERLPSSVDVNELISVGLEEMVKLSRRYDKTKNDSFWGFGKQRVYGSMLDYLRSLDIVSRSNRRLVKAIEKEIDLYVMSHDIEPTNEYLAQKLEETVDKIKEVRNTSMVASVMSLNEQISLMNEESVEESVEKDDILQKVKDVLLTMKEREQMVIQLYYFEELSLKEISEVLNISESRISQIHKKLLITLRDSFSDDEV